MKIEALLPLGKLDPGVRAAAMPLDIARVAADARLAEELGYDGVLTEETKEDPFIVLALAAQATSRVSLATAVAVAFPRSPAVTALSAWSLARLSKGRFTLGLGSQVKGHIERRYGMRWSPPGPWRRLPQRSRTCGRGSRSTLRRRPISPRSRPTAMARPPNNCRRCRGHSAGRRCQHSSVTKCSTPTR